MNHPLMRRQHPAPTVAYTDEDRPYVFMGAARELDVAAERFIRALHELKKLADASDDEVEREHVRSVLTSVAELLEIKTSKKSF